MNAPLPTGALNVLASLLESRTGQQIAANRAWRIETALRPVLRDHEMETLDQLVAALLRSDASALADAVVDALLNQESSFFRDPAVIDLVLEATLALQNELGRRVRVWSAGCAGGQEPLSLAILFTETAEAMRADIVATDVSAMAVERARRGRFSHFEIQRGLSVRRMITWFDAIDEEWVAKPALLSRIAFRRHNLVAEPPPAGGFDIILCRNVLLYFGTQLRREVLGRLAQAIRPGGILVLGAGETVIGQTDAFRPSRRFRGLYERCEPASAFAAAG